MLFVCPLYSRCRGQQRESKYMKIEEFEAELKTIDPNLAIRLNNPPQRVIDMFPDVMKLATITYFGTEVCTIPADEIYDEKNNSYGVDVRADGRFVAHRTRPEALQVVKDKLKTLETKSEADAFFGRGEYWDAALRSQEKKGDVSVVEEVPIDLKEIAGE